MASTNQTSTYQFCQWVENDPVLREDFNADNVKTDAALLGLKEIMDQRKPIVGSYLGTGQNSIHEISLGFRPSWILVMASCNSTGVYINGSGLDFGMCYAGEHTNCLTITANGFRVKGSLNYSPSNGNNEAVGKNPYRYIALR